MSADPYFSLKNTCAKIERYFSDSDIDFSATPRIKTSHGSVVDMAIDISIDVRLTEDQVLEAERIAQEIKELMG